MLGLPEKTKLHRLLPKARIYGQFPAEFTAARKQEFDAHISRIYIEHEISPRSLNIAAGETVAAIFVLGVQMKQEEVPEKMLSLLSRLTGQKTLFVLSYREQIRLAIYETRLLLGEWQKAEELKLSLEGLDTDAVWQSFVLLVSGYELTAGRGLDEQIAAEAEKEKLQRQIETVEKKFWKEVQPRRKFALRQELTELKRYLKNLG